MPKRSNMDYSAPIAAKKLINSRLSYIAPKQLLLAYNYFFNENNLKYISIGFDTEDFKPTVILNHIGESYTRLDLVDWICIFIAKQQDIDDAFISDIKENKKFNCARNMNIHFIAKLNALKIENITINNNEWQTLKLLNDYVQCVMFWCKQLTVDVKNYYKLYVEKCAEKYVYFLDMTEYFIPQQSASRCNFSRMFYELPILCKTKLENDINERKNINSVDLFNQLTQL